MDKTKSNQADVILRENSKFVNEFALYYYIDKVIAESAAKEQGPNDVRYQFLIIGNDLLFAIKSQYQRVRRRIEYRLLHNLERNFGLHFNLVYTDGHGCNIDCFRESKYRVYDSQNGIDANNAFMEWRCFGRNMIITSCYGLRPFNQLGLPHLNKLLECGYDYANSADNKNWTKFETAYERAYGELPIMGFLKMQKEYEKEDMQ